MMIRHFLIFYSPGTFVAETTKVPIDSWDVDTAVRIASSIKERYGARPYAFRFSTRERTNTDLDSRQVAISPYYFLGGRVETLVEIEARNDPNEEILRSNMRNNGYARVLVNDNSWRWTQPLNDDDVVLDVSLSEDVPSCSSDHETIDKE